MRWMNLEPITEWSKSERERQILYIHAYISEKAMATHSSTLAWQIPWMEEPGWLQSMASLGVGHLWATSLSLFTFIHWRRKWQPTPVFLPGESQGRGSLVGCHLWGRTESDTTEATSLSYCYETITIIYCWMKKIRCRAVYMILYLYKAKWKHIYLCQHIQIRAQYFWNDAQKQTAYWEGEIAEWLKDPLAFSESF